MVGWVVEAADMDAVGRAHARAQLAPDAFLHPVLVPVEDVTTVHAGLLGPLLLGVLAGDRRSTQMLEGQLEPAEEVLALMGRFGDGHGRSPPSVPGPTGCAGRDHSRTPTGGTRVSPSSSRSAPMAKA